MEYVDGRPLQQIGFHGRDWNLTQVLNYAAQIADALTAAHVSGIVFTATSSPAISWSPPTDVRNKVVDFGLARASLLPNCSVPTIPLFTQTAEGTIAGTVSYMSPEQAQGRNVDARSDIFSFGAVLYEMLTGARAFHGDTPMSTLADIIHKDPRPAKEIVGDLPRDVETLLGRCLRKEIRRAAGSIWPT